MIVGLTGRKGHGKDTAASVFVEHGFRQLRFADPLKAMLRAFFTQFDLDPELIERKVEGDLKEVPCPLLRDKTPRHAMQTLGTEWGRCLIADDLWVVALQMRATALPNVVVSDVRFPNECEAIHAIGGLVYRVDAGKRVPVNEFSAHSSETAVDALSVDGVIWNEGSVVDLTGQVRQLVGELTSRHSERQVAGAPPVFA